MKNLVRFALEAIVVGVALLVGASYFLRKEFIAVSVDMSGVQLNLFGHYLDTHTSMALIVGFVGVVACRFLVTRIWLQECECSCGPGKCECGCACHEKCPCFFRDKSAANDAWRRNRYERDGFHF